MKLGNLVLQLRAAGTSFSLIGGAAEYALAVEGTLKKEAAFVIPLQDSAGNNSNDTIVSQMLTEQFAVIVAIKNGTNFEDKTGFASYNRLHDIRNEIFGAFLGLDIGRLYGKDSGFTSESLVSYSGGTLLDIDRAFLWYQFAFEYQVWVEAQVSEEADGFLDKIWVDYEMQVSENLPISEKLPIDLFAPDMQQFITFEDIRSDLPEYDTNSEAIAHGLSTGDHYKTAAGDIKTVLSP